MPDLGDVRLVFRRVGRVDFSGFHGILAFPVAGGALIIPGVCRSGHVTSFQGLDPAPSGGVS